MMWLSASDGSVWLHLQTILSSSEKQFNKFQAVGRTIILPCDGIDAAPTEICQQGKSKCGVLGSFSVKHLVSVKDTQNWLLEIHSTVFIIQYGIQYGEGVNQKCSIRRYLMQLWSSRIISSQAFTDLSSGFVPNGFSCSPKLTIEPFKCMI